MEIYLSSKLLLSILQFGHDLNAVLYTWMNLHLDSTCLLSNMSIVIRPSRVVNTGIFIVYLNQFKEVTAIVRLEKELDLVIGS